MNHIDIAIPTYNRARDLTVTLDGLARLQVPRRLKWRVMVVNNCCTDSTSAAVHRFRSVFGNRIHELHAPEPGLNHARNAAIAASDADAIAFIDDDVDVGEQWLVFFCKALSESDCAAVGGRVDLRYPGPRPNWVGTREESDLSRVDLGMKRRLCRPDEIFGLNLAIRRSWFQRVGVFRADLDRQGNCLLSGGETEFLDRVVQAGGSLVYEPRAALWHRVPHNRLNKRWFLRRFYWGIRSGMRIEGTSKSEALARLPTAASSTARASAAYLWRGLRHGWDSSEAYERLRWLMDARAIADESLFTLCRSRKSIAGLG